MLFLAGSEREAIQWHADGMHGRSKCRVLPHSAPVHSPQEIALAKRNGAALLFVSPLYATRSHAGTRPLGMMRFNQLAQLAHPARVIALGGMTRNRARPLNKHLVYGWAAIDAFAK